MALRVSRLHMEWSRGFAPMSSMPAEDAEAVMAWDQVAQDLMGEQEGVPDGQ